MNAVTKSMSGSLLVTLIVALAARGAEQASPQPAQVCEITLPDLVALGTPLTVVAYHRETEGFYQGYALVPGDNRPLRVDFAPTAPFGFFTKDGKELNAADYKTISGVYAYMKPEYRPFRDQFQKGDLVAKRLQEVPGLIRRGDGGIEGTLDVFIASETEMANKANARATSRNLRITLESDAAGKALAGAWTAGEYEGSDRLFRFQDGTVRQGRWTGRWRDDFWRPAPGSELTPGRDWPMVGGPARCGSAIACERPLVEDLADARLLWLSEDVFLGGRGGRRNPLDPTPANDFPSGDDHQGGMAVAGGKVFMYTAFPDPTKLLPDTDLMRVRGVPKTAGASGYIDRVVCLDARTGKTLWRQDLPGGKQIKSGKGGIGLTPCAFEDLAIVRTFTSLMALKAVSGEVVWKIPFARYGGWSHDESPVVIGGTALVKPSHDALAGIDPRTGKKLWSLDGVSGNNTLPVRLVHEGKELAVSVFGVYDAPPETGRLTVIDPQTGTIVAETTDIALNENSPLVVGDLIIANAEGAGEAEGAGKGGTFRLGAYRLEGGTLKRVWTATEPIFIGGRFITPLAHRGVVYLDMHGTDNPRVVGVEAATGKIVHTSPGDIDKRAGHTGGGHWMQATDDRIITDGVLLFGLAADFNQMGPPLRLPFAIGYCCPIQPAIADGRLFIRLNNGIACYDLRSPETNVK